MCLCRSSLRLIEVGRPGFAPGGAPSFLASPRKVGKRSAPHCPCPFRFATGQPAMLALGVRPQNSLRACSAPFRQPRPVRARSMGMLRCPCAPQPLCFSARTEGMGDETGHRYARPPTRERFAPRNPGRAKQWPVWTSPPSGCAWGGVVAGWHVHRRMHVLRRLTGRSCLNGALPSAKRVLRPTPPTPRHRLPRSDSEGVAASRVAFLLGTFLWRSKEKCLGRRAETRPPDFNQSKPTSKRETSTFIAASAIQ